MGKFDEKVVIVTGSSGGIGQDAAIEFGKEGAKVVIHGQNEERLNETEKLMIENGVAIEHILKIIASLEDPQTPKKIIDSTIQKFGRIDVLINNAAAVINPKTKSDPHCIENLDFLYKVNFRSVVELTQLAFPYLEKSHGNVINVSSIGSIRPFALSTFYCSLKGALDNFTRCYSQIYGPLGVRINSINPGPIESLILTRHNLSDKAVDGFNNWSIANTSLKRIGTASETSSVLKFLASDEASYVTGAIWLVDGGTAAFMPDVKFF